jgi:hypothetical protein
VNQRESIHLKVYFLYTPFGVDGKKRVRGKTTVAYAPLHILQETQYS